MGKLLKYLGVAQEWIMKAIEWLGILLHLVKKAEDKIEEVEEEQAEEDKKV